jgi:hypothetical protein
MDRRIEERPSRMKREERVVDMRRKALPGVRICI